MARKPGSGQPPQSPFALLPAEEHQALKSQWKKREYPVDAILAEQGRTGIDRVFLIDAGTVELVGRAPDGKQLCQILRAGEIFGAISVLINGGVALRTALARTALNGRELPVDVFTDLCARYPAFYATFTDTFNKRIRSDSYADAIAIAQAPHLIAKVNPFSFLPDGELKRIMPKFRLVHFPKDTVVYVHGQSRVDQLLIVKQGAAERYFEKGGDKVLRGRLGEGDSYGGISMLVNHGMAVRSLRTTEATLAYALPESVFLELCHAHDVFSEYFTNTFGKRMLDRSYAQSVIHYSAPTQEDVSFFSRTIDGLFHRKLLACPHTLSIRNAAVKMSQYHCSSIFVRDDDGTVIGLVTDMDLSSGVIAKGLSVDLPVSAIMSSPVVSIDANALVFEALMVMMQTHIKHLAVTDADGQVIGVMTNRDMLNAQGQSPIFLIRRVTAAEDADDLKRTYERVPRLIQSLFKGGAKPRNITRMITTISDEILEKVIEFALRDMGPAPVPFAFMILGSEGRQEQTLKTDQDNAIVYRDVPGGGDAEVRAYFLSLGERVCAALDAIGYAFCKGGVMAQNPQWCLPLSEWQHQFHRWIHTAEPEALLQASIFFDFRCGYGDAAIIDELRAFLFQSLGDWPGFFRHMAENALHFKPPIGFFRNFVVESKGEHRDHFDIKSAMMPIVDFARIYSLKHSIAETNTLDRLTLLEEKGALSASDHDDLDQAYSFLMQLRFLRQINALLEENRAPDNYVNPKSLSPIEQTMLKEIFKRLEKSQGRLGFDFIG